MSSARTSIPEAVRVRWLAARSFEIEAKAVRQRVIHDAHRMARGEFDWYVGEGEALPTVALSRIEASPEGKAVRRMYELAVELGCPLEEARRKALAEVGE